ncbi:MAG: amidohydrolase [Subtercola sp.]|nr:amidohydrolase [Subtercola sp.]
MTASLLITDALVYGGPDTEPYEASIRIDDGSITEISPGTFSAGGTDPGIPSLNAAGRFLMPGLIDAHFHAYADTLDGLAQSAQPLSLSGIAGARRLTRALRRGFTTVRDVAGGDMGMAKAISTQLFASPRYLYTGPALSQTGGHGDQRPGDLDICVHGTHVGRVVDGVEDVRLAVREAFRAGATAIKLMTSGGVLSPSDPLENAQFSADEIRAAVDEATRRGTYVAAHSYSPASITHSITNGVRSIEHGNLLDEATAQLMVEYSAYLVPTLITYDSMSRRGVSLGLPDYAYEKNKLVLEAGQRAIEIARSAGVPIGWGSDLLGDLEEEQLNGLRLHLEVETVGNTIDSITRVNADLLNRPDLGRIEVGSLADLVLLEQNPYEAPEALWRLDGRTVIQSGSVFDPYERTQL